jgi:hypothetical protein
MSPQNLATASCRGGNFWCILRAGFLANTRAASNAAAAKIGRPIRLGVRFAGRFDTFLPSPDRQGGDIMIAFSLTQATSGISQPGNTRSLRLAAHGAAPQRRTIVWVLLWRGAMPCERFFRSYCSATSFFTRSCRALSWSPDATISKFSFRT